MPPDYQTIEYKDELLADKTICRTYNNGRIEWRKRLDDRRIEWRDNQSQQGVDELLGDGIVKRTVSSQLPTYGREQGYGRTLWSNNSLTVNRTSFGGKVGAILTGMGGALLLGGLIAPPLVMSNNEEAMLRQKSLQQQQNTGDSSSSGDGGSWDSDTDLGDADSDFG